MGRIRLAHTLEHLPTALPENVTSSEFRLSNDALRQDNSRSIHMYSAVVLSGRGGSTRDPSPPGSESFTGSAIYWSVALGKSLNLSHPQLPQLQSGGNNSASRGDEMSSLCTLSPALSVVKMVGLLMLHSNWNLTLPKRGNTTPTTART